MILISRKSSIQSGINYHKRGVDDNGNTANYVETEQIFIYKDDDENYNVISYNQIRGSIPLFWSQKPDMSNSPHVI